MYIKKTIPLIPAHLVFSCFSAKHSPPIDSWPRRPSNPAGNRSCPWCDPQSRVWGVRIRRGIHLFATLLPRKLATPAGRSSLRESKQLSEAPLPITHGARRLRVLLLGDSSFLRRRVPDSPVRHAVAIASMRQATWRKLPRTCACTHRAFFGTDSCPSEQKPSGMRSDSVIRFVCHLCSFTFGTYPGRRSNKWEHLAPFSMSASSLASL